MADVIETFGTLYGLDGVTTCTLEIRYDDITRGITGVRVTNNLTTTVLIIVYRDAVELQRKYFVPGEVQTKVLDGSQNMDRIGFSMATGPNPV